MIFNKKKLTREEEKTVVTEDNLTVDDEEKTPVEEAKVTTEEATTSAEKAKAAAWETKAAAEESNAASDEIESAIDDVVRKKGFKFWKRKKHEEEEKTSYKTVWSTLAVGLVLIGLLAGATYAWFSASALTKSSSVGAGILNADLMIDKDIIKEVNGFEDDGPDVTPQKTADQKVDEYIEEKGLDDEDHKYERKFKESSDPAAEVRNETYYNITDMDLGLITLKDVEPGQVYPVSFYVENSGDLAFTYTAGFKIEKSLTGLERLQYEANPGEDKVGIYGTDYANHPAYKLRKKVLTREQLREATEEEAEEAEYEDSTGKKYVNIGKGLEDKLKVYIVTDKTSGHIRDNIKAENYVGTVKEIDSKFAPAEDGTPAAPAYTGYLLPEKIVKDHDTGIIVPKHVKVEYEDGTTLIDDDVTEMDRLDFIIVVDEDTNNLYQYAAIQLSIGAYATQVEYEEDGTGYKLYDRRAHDPEIAVSGE